MQSRSLDWFLYDRDLRHERVNFEILLDICENITSYKTFVLYGQNKYKFPIKITLF